MESDFMSTYRTFAIGYPKSTDYDIPTTHNLQQLRLGDRQVSEPYLPPLLAAD